jgi:hypothetical protein
LGQLKNLVLSVFGDLSADPNLVAALQRLIERCMEADTALAPLTAFAFRPRDRSYSGSRYDLKEVVRSFAWQIASEADGILAQLARLGL